MGQAPPSFRRIWAVQRSPYTDRLTSALKKNISLGTIVLRTLTCKKKNPISVPSETSRQLRRVWRVGMRVVNVFRYLTLWLVCMAWYGKNALSSSWYVPTYSPRELICLTLCPKLTAVPHFPNTKLLEFSWIYTYDLWTSTQVHFLCLGNLHSETMETMRIYGNTTAALVLA